MICGIGVDSVEIERFTTWYRYTHQKLKRIFSDDEISYCMQAVAKSAERFAVRFAAKEALLKALTQAGHKLPLLYICKHVSIAKDDNNCPFFTLSHEFKERLSTDSIIFVSLAHTKEYATAFVIIQKI